MALSASQAISGTVMNILHDGQDGQPMRVVIQWTTFNGLFKERGIKNAYVTFEKAQDIKPGDDLHLVARKRTGHSEFMPDQYVVEGDVPVQARLMHQLKDGAEIRRFGKKVAGVRPGFIAAAKSGLMGVFGIKPAEQRHCLVLRPAPGTGNESLEWAAGLLKGIPQYGPSFVIEPEEFGWRTPTDKEQAELSASPDVAEKQFRKKMNGELFARLRGSLPLALDDKWLRATVESGRGSMGINQTVGPAQVHPHSAPISVIKPYDPYATAHSFFTALSGFQATVFSPTSTVGAKWRHAFTTAHELAHSIDAVFGLQKGKGAAHVLKQENFADAFALMAMVQRDGNVDNANVAACWRSMLLVAGGGLDHWTGPSAVEAVRRAGELLQSGKLQHMSGMDIAHEAAAITRKLSLSESDFADLVKRRGRMMRHSGLKTGKSDDGIIFSSALDGGEGAVKAIAKALREQPDMAGVWRPIFQAGIDLVEQLTIGPDVLRKDSAARDTAVQRYRADLKDTAEGLSNHRLQQVLNLRLAEHRRLSYATGGYLGDLAQIMGQAMEVPTVDYATMIRVDTSPEPKQRTGRVVRAGIGPGSQWLEQAFAKSPRARIERLVDVMAHEASCWQSFNRDQKNKELAEQTRQAVLERRALCFAVEQDDEAMALVRLMSAGPFRQVVIEGAENEAMGVWSTIDQSRLARASRAGAAGLNKLKP